MLHNILKFHPHCNTIVEIILISESSLNMYIQMTKYLLETYDV